MKDSDLVYFPVPKCASTSLKAALLKDKRPDLFTVDEEGRETRPNVHRYFAEARPLRLSDQLFVRGEWLCIIRDPVERFVSGYRDRIHKTNDLANVNLGNLPVQPEIDEFAANLAVYMRASGSIRHHFRPMNDFLGKRPKRFDYVFNMNQMSELIAFLNQHGIPVTLRHDRRSQARSVAVSHSLRRTIENFYADDYRYWSAYLA